MIETDASSTATPIRFVARSWQWQPVAVGTLGILLLTQVRWRQYLEPIDLAAKAYLGGFHADRATFVRVRLLSGLVPYLAAAFVAAGLWTAYRRGARVKDASRVLLMLAIGLLEIGLLKVLFFRTRPSAPGAMLHAESFPSGHVANLAFCVAGALHLIQLRPRRRDTPWAGIAVSGCALSVTIAWARIYLERHWATDVAASLALGFTFWAVAAPRAPRGQAVWVALLLVTGICVAGGIQIPLPSPAAVLGARH